MSVTRYNKIFNLSIAVLALYNILCLAGVILSIEILGDIIRTSAIIYLIYSIAMLCYKIKLTRFYFLGSYAIKNLVAHGVLTGSSVLLILVAIF